MSGSYVGVDSAVPPQFTGNLDGGSPDTNFGGITVCDGGRP